MCQLKILLQLFEFGWLLLIEDVHFVFDEKHYPHFVNSHNYEGSDLKNDHQVKVVDEEMAAELELLRIWLRESFGRILRQKGIVVASREFKREGHFERSIEKTAQPNYVYVAELQHKHGFKSGQSPPNDSQSEGNPTQSHNHI